MRNWYETEHQQMHQHQQLLCLVGHYLWGIDTLLKLAVKISFYSLSDITYEELIQLLPLVIFRLWPEPQTGRTLPMRNWYNHSIPAHAHLHEQSDITYEELILAPSGRRPPVTWASRTLPMRNWYSLVSNRSPLTYNSPVGHYLWGIDTFPKLGH